MTVLPPRPTTGVLGVLFGSVSDCRNILLFFQASMEHRACRRVYEFSNPVMADKSCRKLGRLNGQAARSEE